MVWSKKEGDSGQITGFFHEVKAQRDAKYKGSHHEGKIQHIDQNIAEKGDQERMHAESFHQGAKNGSQGREDGRGDAGDHPCKNHGKIWEKKEAPELGELRYLTLRLLHEIKDMPKESELDTCFTRSQIAIVKAPESLILADLSRRITAKEMAERFGISASSFKWYVRGILGDSYLSYFRKKRMEKAAELLENTGLKVIEIANQVGYENQGKFARVFAETYGVTPLEFRRCRRREG